MKIVVVESPCAPQASSMARITPAVLEACLCVSPLIEHFQGMDVGQAAQERVPSSLAWLA